MGAIISRKGLLRPRLAGWRASGSVFGPAQFIQGLLESGERQADDVEVAAFDARNEAARTSLDAVGAGFVVLLPRSEVSRNLFRGEDAELNQRGLGEGDAFRIREPNERNSGDDGVRSPGKFYEHAACVVRRARLAENVAVERYFRIRCDYDRRAHGARRDQFGLGGRQTLDEVLGGFTRVGGFVDRGGEHGKRDSHVPKNFGASRGCGSQDQFHGVTVRGRILQREGRRALAAKRYLFLIFTNERFFRA